jgi:membrane protein YqaA with SNARE-associated domain
MSLLTLWLTTFAVCVVGSFIPLVNTEVYLISVSAFAPVEFVIPLVIAATGGQMAGKVVMFYAGRGILRLKSERVRTRVLALREKLSHRPTLAKATLFSSATLGLPPLYVVSIACGAIGMGVGSFFVLGTVGRLIHFGVVAMLPQYAKLVLN